MLDQTGGKAKIRQLEKRIIEIENANNHNDCCCVFEDVIINFNAINPQGSNIALRPLPTNWAPGTGVKFINIANKAEYYNTTIEYIPMIGTHNNEAALIFENVNWIINAGVPSIVFKKKVACVTSI